MSVSNSQNYELSVVIATLGGNELVNTIRVLNTGKKKPAEILISIPEAQASVIKDPLPENVRIVGSPVKGQVAQRAYALKETSQPMVMQLDDDMEMPENELQQMINLLCRLGAGNAIAPVFRHASTKKYLTRCHHGLKGRIQSLLVTTVCGAKWGTGRMGTISPAGIAYGVDPAQCSVDLVETEWLPGGCVICFKEDLVLNDYYPFTGKAYSEDLIHSVLWRKQGTRLWIAPNVVCETGVVELPFNKAQLKADYLAHLHVVKMINGQKWRLRLWYILYILKRSIKSFASKFRR